MKNGENAKIDFINNPNQIALINQVPNFTIQSGADEQSMSSDVSITRDTQSMSSSIDESGYLNGNHLISKKKVRSPRSLSQNNAGLSKFPCKPKFLQGKPRKLII